MKTKIQNKKIYSKPLLEVIAVDHEISLVMESMPPGSEDPGGVFSAQQIDPANSGPAQVSSTSADSDPFGGSTPQY